MQSEFILLALLALQPSQQFHHSLHVTSLVYLDRSIDLNRRSSSICHFDLSLNTFIFTDFAHYKGTRLKTLTCTGKKTWNAVSCALSGSTVAIPHSQIWSLSLAASESLSLSLSLSLSELSLCVSLSRARGFSESRPWFETLEETLKEQRFFVTSIPRRCCCCYFFFSLSLSLIILSVRLIFRNTKKRDCVLSSFVCVSSSIRSEKVSCPPSL